VGASLAFGTAAAFVIRAARSPFARNLVYLGLSVYVALLVGFGQVVQADYARSWTLQRAFWSALVPLVPDLDDGVVILVEPDGLQDTLQIDANTWNLPRILSQIYAFPETWHDPPRVYRLRADWRAAIAAGVGEFAIDRVGSGPPFHRTVASSRVILITSAEGVLERAADTLELDGTTYALRPAEASVEETPARGPLYAVLIQGSQPELGLP